MLSTGKIVIIERDLAEAARLSLDLKKLGYTIDGIFSRPKEALSFMKDRQPDLVLLHENLKGKLNGMELDPGGFPILYFNKNSSASKLSHLFTNYAGIDVSGIRTRITHAYKQLQKKKLKQSKVKDNLFILKDRVFIRSRDRMIKIALDEICYFEADRNYCKVHTTQKTYLLVSSLKDVAEKIINPRFVRVHRSFLVNLSHIEEIASNDLVIGKRSIPVSKAYRYELLKHFQIL